MTYISLTNAAKVVDWARTLVTQLNQRDAGQFSGLVNAVNDAAAAAAGVPVNGVYRNGSVLMVRVS